MTTKYGMFKEHVYLKPEVPPGLASTSASQEQKPGEEPLGPIDREHGLNMKAPAAKTGKGNDAMFGKFIYRAGDRYVDPLRARLQSEANKTAKNIVDKPFKTAGDLKKHACPGDFYGTSGKVPYIPPLQDVKAKKGEIPEKPRGIYTAPAKKGTFGYDKLTISQRVGHKGVATEYEYQHEPFSLQQQRQKQEREAERKARASEAPFKPANPPKKGGYGVPNTTISKGKGVAGEWEYVLARSVSEGGDAKKGKEPAAADASAPFRPSNAFASQRIEPIPYLHDPEAPKLKAESDRRLSESKRIATTGAWRPTQTYKTDMVRSIVRMNLR